MNERTDFPPEREKRVGKNGTAVFTHFFLTKALFHHTALVYTHFPLLKVCISACCQLWTSVVKTAQF